MQKVRVELERSNGYIRYSKDGLGTCVEDETRGHYEPHELRNFDKIECQWPVFDAQMLIASHFTGNRADLDYFRPRFRRHLGSTIFNKDSVFFPTFYYVEEGSINDARDCKSGVKMTAKLLKNHQWVQSMAVIAVLLDDGFIRPCDIDPLRTFDRVLDEFSHQADNEIRVSLISENSKLRTMLSTFAVESETPQQLEPIVVWPTQGKNF